MELLLERPEFHMKNSLKLQKSFFENNTLWVAENLIGKILRVRIDDDSENHNETQILSVIITETEAYHGPEDDACHAYNHRKTDRNKVMYGEAGYTYIYLTYGLHYMFNIVTDVKNFPAAVLIRGATIDLDDYVEFTSKSSHKPFSCSPQYEKLVKKYLNINNADMISQNRFNKNVSELNKYQQKNLLNGPGKVTQAFKLSKKQNNQKVFEPDSTIWFEDIGVKVNKKFIKRTPRIGIDYAEKSKEWEYRFVV